MPVEKEKLAKVVAAIWIFLAIPISQDFYDEILNGGFFMRIFALVAVAAPVWIVFGWRWLTNDAPVALKFWGLITITGILLFLVFANNYDLDEIAYIPLLATFAFLGLVWVYEKGEMLASLKKLFENHLRPHVTPNFNLDKYNNSSPEKQFDILQQVAEDNSPIHEKGFGNFAISIHMQLVDKLGLHITHDVDMDQEYDAALMALYKSAYKQCYCYEEKDKQDIANSLIKIVTPFYIAHKGDRVGCLKKIREATDAFEKFNMGESFFEEIEPGLHPALDKTVNRIRNFLSSEILKGADHTDLDLGAELITYAATYVAMKEQHLSFDPAVWNSFKSSIENRMLAIKEDGSPRSGVEITEDGHQSFVSYTSFYYGWLDNVEASNAQTDNNGLRKAVVSKILKKLNISPDQFGSFTSNFDETVETSTKNILSAIKKSFS